MKFEEYISYDALGLASLIKQGEISSHDAQHCAIEAINQLNPKINAVVETFPEAQSYNPDGPFSGIPFLIKDSVINAKGIKSEVGSRLGAGMVAPDDTFLMQRFRKAGLATVGRTTTPEFSFNVTGESLFNGPTRNPWAFDRIAGGSSSGAASAVAAGIVPMAHANDGGGSIRIPAACCGLVGLKPSRGRISLGPYYGEALNGLGIEFAVTRSVRDTAALLDAVQGAELGEPYIIAPPQTSYINTLTQPVRPLRIAVSATPSSGVPIDADCVIAFEQTVQLLRDLGHEVVEAAPQINHEAFSWATTQFWAANVAAWAEHIAEHSGREINESTVEATTLATYRYGKQMSAFDLLGASAIANELTRSVATFFAEYDLMLTPSNKGVAAPLGVYNANDSSLSAHEWVDHIFSFAPFTALFNMTGQPAISLPLQHSPDGLPIGMQLVASFGREDLLLQLAKSLEDAKPWPATSPLWMNN